MSEQWNRPQDGAAAGGPEPSQQGPLPQSGPSFQSPGTGEPRQQGPRPNGPASPETMAFGRAGYTSAPFGPPFDSAPNRRSAPHLVPPPEPQAKTKVKEKRRAGRSAGALFGVALLAAGVGAGSTIVVDRYLLDNPQQAPVAASETPSQTNATTVVQADPNAPDWSKVSDVASRSVVAIQVQTENGAGQGSGVVIDTKGNIVTNNHVVNGATWLLVTLGDRSYEAELVGTDPSTDLAVIRIVDPPKDLKPMAWGDSNKLVVGDPVMAIGNPLGLSGTVTTGIVSALDRPVTTRAVGDTSRDTVVTAAVQTNAAINPGNSGGALVNGAGELVGITTSIASLPGAQTESGQAGNIGIGFAIGSDQARNIAQQLLDNGTAQHPQVGVTARDVREVGPRGAQVASVVADSPADKAGLQEGDIITAVNDRQVSSTTQLVGLVRAQKVGEPITVSYQRDGKEATVEVTPTAAPN